MTETAEARRAVLAWRREQRAALIAGRLAMPMSVQRHASRIIGQRLLPLIQAIRPAVLAGYWPFRREFNPIPILREQLSAGVRIALPVVRGKNQPLEFRLWRPGIAMALGVYNIPYPADAAVVVPDALLIPMVGFDAAGYRLGYGGGYYDRTAAALSPCPYLIGTSFELARMPTARPLAHDIPMDCVITEETTHVVGSRPINLPVLQS